MRDVLLEAALLVLGDLAVEERGAQRGVLVGHVLGKPVAEQAHVVEVDVIEEVLLAGKDRDDLVGCGKGCKASLLEELHHVGTVVELVLRSGVKVGAKLREGLLVAVCGKVETQRASNLLHGLVLGIAANPGDRDAHVHSGALALEEQVGLQVNLTIGDGNHVGGDVGGDVTLLRLDDGKRRKRAAAVLVGQLACALEETRVQVEDVARVSLTSRRTVQRQRHLTVSHSLLGEVIVDHEDVRTGVRCVCGFPLASLYMKYSPMAAPAMGAMY